MRDFSAVPVLVFLLVASTFFIVPLSLALAQNRPPVAAPTARVAVEPLPVVRAESEAVTDFSTGLLNGLMATDRVPGFALSVVKRDQPMVQKGFGMTNERVPVDANTVFDAGSLSEVIAALGAMQLIEQGRLAPGANLGNAVGDGSLARVTAADLLTQKRNDLGALARVVATVSRQNFSAYARERIFEPLDMAASRIEDGGSLTTTAADMGKLMLALVNRGTYNGARILLPETIDLMGRTHFVLAPGLSGWGYGFAVAERNGWRAWERDGRGDGSEVRLVVVPDAQTGYFAATTRPASAAFWQAFDDSLFNRLFVSRGPIGNEAPAAGAAPQTASANIAFGTYLRVNAEPRLMVDRGPLRALNRGDGTLVLSGAARGVLMPIEGGSWRNNVLGVEAKFAGGFLSVNRVVYAIVPLWRTPFLYAVLGFLTALAALIAGVVAWRLRSHRRFAMRGAIGLSVLSACSMVAAALIWLLPAGS